VFLSIDPNINIQPPPNWDRFLGHDKRWKEGGPGTIGYSEAGVFRDVLLVPPLSNITVSRNFVAKHATEVDINSMFYMSLLGTVLTNEQDEWIVAAILVEIRHRYNSWYAIKNCVLKSIFEIFCVRAMLVFFFLSGIVIHRLFLWMLITFSKPWWLHVCHIANFEGKL